MKQKIRKINRLLDDTLQKACAQIPQKKRKVVVFGMCFLFVVVFSFMLWDSFYNQEANKAFEIKHIEPLDLEKDSVNQKFKNEFHGNRQ
jgi:type II secretory pathway component PulM